MLVCVCDGNDFPAARDKKRRRKEEKEEEREDGIGIGSEQERGTVR